MEKIKARNMKKRLLPLLLVAVLALSSMTALAAEKITVTTQVVLDNKEVAGAANTIQLEQGYVLTSEDVADLGGLDVEEDQILVGLYWDAAGTKAVKAGDVLDTDATLYLLVKTQENTPSPTPNPNPTPNPAPNPTPTPNPTPAPEPTPEKTSPETGDQEIPVWLFAVMVAAGAAVVRRVGAKMSKAK